MPRFRLGSPLRYPMADRIGPLAIMPRKPRQVRKEATVAVSLGAGVWQVRDAAPPARYAA